MIRKYPNKPGWTEIRYTIGSTRKRETIKDSLVDARIAQIENDLKNFRIPLTDKEVEEYRAAKHLLPDGMTLVQAVMAAGGIPTAAKSPHLLPAIEQYLDHCRSKGLSPRTVSDRTQHLRHFKGAAIFAQLTRVDAQLTSFTWNDIDRYLKAAAPKTANTRRATLVSFFDFWRKISGVDPAAPHPVRQVECRKVAAKDPVPFTPDNLHKLIRTATSRNCPDSLMFITLGAHLGVRAAEVGRLTWGDVWDATNHKPKASLALSSSITKTNRRRVVPITAAAVALITWCADLLPFLGNYPPDMPVVSGRVRRHITATAAAAGVEWIDNGLRKGYVSACVTLLGAEQTAAYAGHSISVLESNYKALVSEEDAKKWFALPE